MLSKMTESPLTLGGGVLCALGLILLIMGLAFKEGSIRDAGMGMIGTGATLIGIFARDNAASARARAELQHDVQEVKLEVKQTKEEVREEAKGVARTEAREAVQRTR